MNCQMGGKKSNNKISLYLEFYHIVYHQRHVVYANIYFQRHLISWVQG